jgi:hypothetical protein
MTSMDTVVSVMQPVQRNTCHRIRTDAHATAMCVVAYTQAMLTGESAPVVKYALPLTALQGSPPGFDAAKHSKHLMLSGTLVLQVCTV